MIICLQYSGFFSCTFRHESPTGAHVSPLYLELSSHLPPHPIPLADPECIQFLKSSYLCWEHIFLCVPTKRNIIQQLPLSLNVRKFSAFIIFILNFLNNIKIYLTQFILSFPVQFCLSRVPTPCDPWTAARQPSVSITNSQVYLNSCALIRWCHPNTSSSVVTFSSHL